MPHIAKWAASGADITHNHKSSGALGKTFTQIGAGSLFTNGKKVIFSQYRL
jgi:hypothetical protein